jgi:hypothetical protein
MLGALSDVRRSTLHEVGELLAGERKYLSDLAREHDAFASELAQFRATPSEPRRLAVRRLAEELRGELEHIERVHREVAGRLEELRASTERIAEHARVLHDPARVDAASASAALRCLDREVAKKWADGDIEIRDVRAFFGRRDEHSSACAYMRAAGGNVREVAATIFILPLLEQFAERGIAAVSPNMIFHGDMLPDMQAATKFGAWVRDVSDRRPNPAQAAALKPLFARIRRAVEASPDVRDSASFERYEAPAAAAAPPPTGDAPAPVRNVSGPRGVPVWVERGDGRFLKHNG